LRELEIKPEHAEKDPSEDLAQWLQEVGQRRVNSRPKDDDAKLLAHLERVSGRKINRPEDISDYISELSQKAATTRSKRQHIKNALLGALLVIAVLQYYFIDVQLQILLQPSLTVFVRTVDLAHEPRVRM
jgi:hypothetical protein